MGWFGPQGDCGCCGCDCTNGLLFDTFSDITTSISGALNPTVDNDSIVSACLIRKTRTGNCVDGTGISASTHPPLLYDNTGACSGSDAGYYQTRRYEIARRCDGSSVGGYIAVTENVGIVAEVQQFCDGNTIKYYYRVAFGYEFQSKGDSCNSFPVPWSSSVTPPEPSGWDVVLLSGGRYYWTNAAYVSAGDPVTELSNGGAPGADDIGVFNRTRWGVTVFFESTVTTVAAIPTSFSLVPAINTLGMTGSANFI